MAKADTFENEIQVGGTFDHNGVSWIGMTLPISIPGGTNPNTGQSYAVIRTGDRLVWQQEQFNARGGMCLFDSNGASTSWSLHAQDGDLTNSWHDTSGGWLTRVVSLDSWAGRTLSSACVVVDGETNSITNGSPSLVLVNNAAILRADGSVLPIYQSGQGQPGWQIWQGQQSGNAISGTIWNIRHLQGFNTATYPSASTTHYLADHLGSTSLALTVEGWPTQTSEFQPYGQEINPVASANHYKFIGKERDVESGLDYFGARYFSSTLGRFMSPDWSSVPQPVPYADLGVPQTLNLYAYAGNNPVSIGDATGHSPGIFNPLNYTLLMAGEVENWQQQLQNDMQNANAAQKRNSGEGSDSNVAKRDALASAAYDQAKGKSTAWAQGTGAPKCNVFVCAMLNKVGIGGPTYPGGDNPLVAQDWANPKFKVDNWRVLGAGEAPQAGDVAAYKESFSNATGHSGIVTGNENGTIRVVAAGSTSIYQTTAGSKYFGQGMVITYRRYTGQ